MKNTQNVRNISVIAHVDHGKSTLVDSLLAKGGLIKKSRAGTQVGMDTEQQEIDRGITIKSCGVTLLFKRKGEHKKKQKDNQYLINLIDSPGHVDFSSEVTAALRVTDGALVVVDCIEGVMVQTETVLRQAVQERIKPVLFLNKLDRQFLEVHTPLEEMYKSFNRTIESVNAICATYKDREMSHIIDIKPTTAQVGFGSGLHCWGFTLKDFAMKYCGKYSVKPSKLMKYFWGDNYFDRGSNTWRKSRSSLQMQRGFCEFILKPIQVLMDAIINKKKSIYEPIIKCLGLKFSKQDLADLRPKKWEKDFMKLVMRTWLPASDTLVEMVCQHLPSPVEAQQYRIPMLYTGSVDTEEAQLMMNCNVDAPLSMYISKMVPQKGNPGQFIAFGRVFSGSVKPGQTIRIMAANYEHGQPHDLEVRKVQRVLCMKANSTVPIKECPAGNICGLVGIDKYLVKSGTLSTSPDIQPFHTMKFSVSAVVQVAVEPVKPGDLQKLVSGLRKLAQYDPLIQITIDKDQRVIAGAGELHLDCSLKTLRDDYMNGAEIKVSNPITSFRETITDYSGSGERLTDNTNNRASNYPSQIIGKSSSGLNRLIMNAEPINDAQLVADLDSNNFAIKHHPRSKQFTKQFMDTYHWSKDDSNKIWTFGCPPDAKANLIVDQSKSVQYLQEVRDNVIQSFMNVSERGVLCGEPLYGCRFNVLDAKIHRDPSHRGSAEIVPAARKCFYAAQLASKPRLMEPIYEMDISVPKEAENGVHKSLTARRAVVHDYQLSMHTPMCRIKAHIPVLETFGDAKLKKQGFLELLRKNTGGKAFASMRFSHWQLVNGDPLKDGTFANKLVMDVRRRKAMKMEIPKFEDFHDKK